MITAPDRLLHQLEWRVVRRLDGRLQGGYRTARRGSGLDFAGLRPYVDGDDARHIDWNVTARLDEPQVREFTEDRELTAWLVLDRSASMGVGGPGRGKQDVLTELALVLARLLGRNGNRVGAVLLRLRRGPRGAPGTGRAPGAADRTRAGSPGRAGTTTTDLAEMLDTVASLARRSLVVVISDFIGTGEWQRPLLRLAHRNEVVAVRVVDAADDALPEVGADHRRGRRDRRAAARRLRRSVVPRPVPRRGRRAGRGLRAGMRRAGVPLHRVDTGSDLVEALLGDHRADAAETARMSLSQPLLLVVGLLAGRRAGRRLSSCSAAGGPPPCRRPGSPRRVGRRRPLGLWLSLGRRRGARVRDGRSGRPRCRSPGAPAR